MLRLLAISGILLFTGLVAFIPLNSSDSATAQSTVTTRDTFETNERAVALTFDVTFDRGDAAEVLDILRDRGVTSTWAITGVWAERNPDLMQRIVDEGHQLINHTWHHLSLTGDYTGSITWEPTDPLPYDQVVRELMRVDELVQRQVGVDMRPYVRPPFGDYSDETLAAFAETGYTENIMWTVDTEGWYGIPADEVVERALDAAEPGANILMHIGHGSTDGEALPGIIDGYRDMGYEFATVEDFVEGRFSDPARRFYIETGYDLVEVFQRFRQRVGF
jgi:peptidoglycan-N-acetylglucosamine deacetylase